MSRGAAFNNWERTRYARRVASGVCVTCGGVRAEGDARLCQPCRERHRASVKACRVQIKGVGSSVHRHERTVADVGAPVRPLVFCRTCCDLPWRRPRSGCPCCGGAYAREDTRDAALMACERRSVGPWE